MRRQGFAAQFEERNFKRDRLRRFPWCRLHNDLLSDPRWRLVSQLTDTPLFLVEAFVVRMEAFANANTPRGSLEGLSIRAIAAHWNLPSPEPLERIHAACRSPDVSWIDQEHLVTFWDRNPDTEDPTARERMQRMRARLREEKALLNPGVLTNGGVAANGRNVTAISDQIIKKQCKAFHEINATGRDAARSDESKITQLGVRHSNEEEKTKAAEQRKILASASLLATVQAKGWGR